MAKNILIFSDGTGQAGGLSPDQRLSNIYKLYRATRVGPDNAIDPDAQVAFYDAGLGTDVDAASVPLRIVRRIRKLASSATGTGLGRNIVDCYEAILKVYEPGDRIYLFGFSRGAYTARCVAGVLGLCGVPTKMPNGDPIPKGGGALRTIASEAVHRVYQHGSGRDRRTYAPERKELAKRFRAKYSSGTRQANVVPYFVGVFDTVAALGATGFRWLAMNAFLLMLAATALFVVSLLLEWGFGVPRWTSFPWLALFAGLAAAVAIGRARLKVIRDYPEKSQFNFHWSGWRFKFYDTYLNPRVVFARHALAIDETRKDFDRVRWGQRRGNRKRQEGEPEPFVQLWFAGNHSNIGGSYAEEESRLSDVALDWMIGEATTLPSPIMVDRTRLQLFPRAHGMQHSEVETMLDRYPSWVPKWLRRGWRTIVRDIPNGATLHATVEERFKLPAVQQCNRMAPYRPEALRNDSRYAQFYVDKPQETMG